MAGRTKPRQRPTPRKKKDASEPIRRWRDVTLYFHSLDANRSGLSMLARSIRSYLRPANVLERLWCDDIIAITWQAHQLREIKRYVVFDGAREVVSTRLKLAANIDPRKDTNDDPRFDASATAFVLGVPETETIEDALVEAGSALNMKFEMGYLARARELEDIDRLVFAHEKRRDDLIDRIEKRRNP